MLSRVLSYIRRLEMMRPGDRVGVAVSGGADSVGLLRIMLELRESLGVVLAVAHFNHRIRGEDAQADERFVAELAATHGLPFHCSSADTPAYAREHGLSLEAAGRELRYAFFRSLLAGASDVVATAHTMDDQAETVLLRIMRGAGTRGIAGIYPKWSVASGQWPERQQLAGVDHQSQLSVANCQLPSRRLPAIVRPLLTTRRSELRDYLRSLRQPWREDASNLDVKHTRNRLRQELLPLIERQFNPSIVNVLAEMAEIARGEEAFWNAELERLLPAAADSLDTQALKALPLALQRRVVQRFAENSGYRLDFHHVEAILELAGIVQPLESKEVELPGDGLLTATFRELRVDRRGQNEEAGKGYEYRLTIPGEVQIAELGKVLRVTLVQAEEASSGYNQGHLLDFRRLAPELLVRNWRPGDRFWPAHSKSPRKLKELLLRCRIAQPQRAIWPVVLSGDRIVWVPRLGPAAELLATGGTGQAVVIEEVIPAC